MGLVGGTFGGTLEINPIFSIIQNGLTNGVNQIYAGGLFGVSIGGTPLFNPQLAALWKNNVLTVLDEGVFSDTNWTRNDNSQFAINVANWIANSNADITVDNIVYFIDTHAEIVGIGPGKSANNKFNAFLNMLQTAGSLIESGDNEDACHLLKSIAKKCDQEDRPPDFITGPELLMDELMVMINVVIANLGCE